MTIKKLYVSIFSLPVLYAGTAFAGGKSGHHESAGGLPQLDPTYFASQTFWLIIVFVIMYVIFATRSLPTISTTIENRAERIKNDLSSAERVKEEVESVQQSYEESLKEAREKSSKLFADIEKQIKSDSENHAKQFIETSAKKTSALEKSINDARKKAMNDMSSIAADIATDATEKIIGVKTDKKSAKKVVESINKTA